MRTSIFFSLTVLIFLLSCQSENTFEDHNLVGNYLGQWITNPSTQDNVRITIEPDENKDGLILFLNSVGDSIALEQIKDSEFMILDFQQNGKSNNLSGLLINDTLKIENRSYFLNDPNNLSIRNGVFARQ